MQRILSKRQVGMVLMVRRGGGYWLIFKVRLYITYTCGN